MLTTQTSDSRSPKGEREYKKVRYAVVGLGWIAGGGPARVRPRGGRQRVDALVSKNPKKRERLGKRCGVAHTYSYEEYDECLNSGAVDAVYIALPNHMHREFTERAARAGVHVLCEKPMAITEEDCEAMIRACDEAGVKLMIAYRLHYEEANLRAIETAQSGELGELRFYHAVNVQQVAPGNVRLDKESGGGPLYDLGIYCINAARYLFRDEPEMVVALTANKGEERFSEIHELIAAIRRFPGERLATFTCGFSNPTIGTYRIVGTKGELLLDPAFPFQGGMKHYLTIDGTTRESSFPVRDQFAPELIEFARCIREDRDPEPSGAEGLADVRIIRAIHRAALTGSAVQLGPFRKDTWPSLAQKMTYPAIATPDLIDAADPFHAQV